MEWTPRQYPRVKAVLPVELHRATVTVPLRAQTKISAWAVCTSKWALLRRSQRI